MPNFQRTEIIGHVGKDPEIRQSANGLDIAKFSVAVSEKYKDNEHTEWFNVVVFGKSVENYISKYVRKGGLVRVEGKLKTNKWEDDDGNTRYKTELIAANFGGVMTLGGKHGDAKPQREARPRQDFDDMIPF